MASMIMFSPSGVVPYPANVRRAALRLNALGFEVQIDEAAFKRHQRFAGDDEVRLAALHRVARAQPSVAMATRGGYGLTRKRWSAPPSKEPVGSVIAISPPCT